ncbi:MAG TPA: excinuclease ABC subunit UvrB, partial [Victivallales bacterium]|nr:excinuclease ABC subunit UvrB [Victivallales bacterium]
MFKLYADFPTAGDQPEAIKKLVDGIRKEKKYQTLLGVTGSGKTFTIANVIKEFNMPVLVLSHNKTLAAQLFSEFKSFFPENAVEFFISYYDYYLPEAYIPQTDTYIAKDASINEDIERLRLSATSSLIERCDVIIVASVSCIYGLGSPEDFTEMSVIIEKGKKISRKVFLDSLVTIQYDRNDISPQKGQFRVRGDSVDVFLPNKDIFVRVSFWEDEVEEISVHHTLTARTIEKRTKVVFFPCKHFVIPQRKLEIAIEKIKAELEERVKYFESKNLLVEAQRIYQRTMFDIEMMQQTGYCSGIENYSFHLSNRLPGQRPFCLIDFFPEKFITVIDESHVTIPQLMAMYKADRSRKLTLIEHGFRLPSALENRPLTFDEFRELTSNKTIFVSATPGDYEISLSGQPVEQIVRPTGLLDPEPIIRPLKGQIEDLVCEIRKCAEKKQRSLAITLTKKSAERLCDYLRNLNLNVQYIHSEIDALERAKILCELRKGNFDCLVGINLLREGIDLPEVSLVAILDADKEGFLRSERSLIQIAGRAARNINGKVILYADKITESIKNFIKITENRRKKQSTYNKKYSITPRTIKKEIR